MQGMTKRERQVTDPDQILHILDGAQINIEYVYAFTSPSGSAYVVMRVNDNDEAEAVLQEKGKVTLCDADMAELM